MLIFYIKKGFEKLSRAISGISSFLQNRYSSSCNNWKKSIFRYAIGVVIGSTSIIEDDVLIYQGVTLGGVSLNKGKRHPTIKSNVVIGSGAKILGNIEVGSNSKLELILL